MTGFHKKREALGLSPLEFALLVRVGVSTVYAWDTPAGPQAPAWAHLLLDIWTLFPETLTASRSYL